VFLLAFLGLNVVAGAAYVAFRLFAGPDLMDDAGASVRIPETHLIALLLVIEPLTVGLVILLRRFLDRESVTSLGLSRTGPWARRLLTGMLHATIVMIVIGAAVAATSEDVVWTQERAVSLAARFALYAVLFAAVGFTEEFVMRGYVLRNLLLDVNRTAAVALSAAFFAVLHAANPGAEPLALANVFLVGAYLALVAVRDGSIWYPIGFHFAWNLLLGFVLSMPVSGVEVHGAVIIERDGGSSIFSGGAFGPEGSLVCSLLLLGLVALALRGEAADRAAGRASAGPPEGGAP
jgi:membrane protease YdiL (CAAX protease family)